MCIVARQDKPNVKTCAGRRTTTRDKQRSTKHYTKRQLFYYKKMIDIDSQKLLPTQHILTILY
jgi:hypothetical protein